MVKKIYFMGIKGVGMATLAVIAKQAGIEVAGSDIGEFITDKILESEDIKVYTGFSEKNVEDFFSDTPISECLFIATGAHNGFDNVESEFAKSKNIKVISHGEAVGIFMDGKIFGRNFEGISVSGSHGKTTICGMLASVLILNNYDPSFTVGTSEIFPVGPAGHFGKGDYFIAEADEYVAESRYQPIPKFLYQKPQAIIVNNIDFDHPDYYKDIEAVKNAYFEFISSLSEESLLVINGDDEKIIDILQKFNVSPKILTYGTGGSNEFKVKDFREKGFGSSFSVLRGETLIGEFNLSVPGYHNAKNSLAVISLLIELGVSIDKIAKGLEGFKGVKRRLEIVGKTKKGQTIIDDYAHHPEEIKKTIEALNLAFPDKKIVSVFQPHTFSRTQALLSDFVASFAGVSEIILLPTFASLRDERDDTNYDEKILSEFAKINKKVNLINTFPDVVEYISYSLTDPEILILIMGAGDVYKISEKLKDS